MLTNQSLATNRSEIANSKSDDGLEPLVVNDSDLERRSNRENRGRSSSESQISVFEEIDNPEVTTRSGRLVKQHKFGDCLYY